jgi:hypothetical protein
VVRADSACGANLDVDVVNLHAGSTAFPANAAACDRSIGSSQPGGTVNLSDTVGLPLPIPEWPTPDLWRVQTVSHTSITTATLSVSVTHPRQTQLVANLFGPNGNGIVVTAAINGSIDVTGFLASEGVGDYTLRIVDTFAGLKGTLDSWALTLNVAPSSSCTPCAAGSCAAPTVSLGPTLSLCADRIGAFTADFTAPGAGSFDYSWDFGDGLGPQPVADPFVTVYHRFDASQPSYTVTFRAASRSSASCDEVSTTTVDIVPGTVPTGGPIGNRLRMWRAGIDAGMSWTGSGLNPPAYKVLKTFAKTELGDTLAGIGDEGVAARLTVESFTDVGAVPTTPELIFVEVHPEDSCGVTAP